MRRLSEWVTAVFLVPALLCLHHAYSLASRGLGGWGWFLFVSLIFWGVVFNAMTGRIRVGADGKPPMGDDGLE